MEASKKTNFVTVLHTGYSREDTSNENAMRANCTCTLVRCRDGTNIIVDTMTAWDGEFLKSLLAEQGLSPEDIHIVVCTHGHSDHVGCNYLFDRARLHIVGSCISCRDLYYTDDNNRLFVLDTNNEVVVEKTPGHTMSCVSIIVANTQMGGTIGICGDLFERCEDIADPVIWKNAGSEDEKQQTRERLRLANLCSYIVPGHGPLFAIDVGMRSKLKSDCNNDE